MTPRDARVAWIARSVLIGTGWVWAMGPVGGLAQVPEGRATPQTTAVGQPEAAAGEAALALTALSIPDGIPIELDGRLDEAVWATAVPATQFTQQEPVEGGTPSEGMEIRVLYDADRLYIGATVYDDPAGILAYQRERDAGLGTDDRFMWILDTFHDGRTGYFFEINPAGLMGDGLISGGGSLNKSWDGIWEARTAENEDGWSAEIEIPFRTLNFDRDLDTWGINFQRTIRRRNEEILWSGWRRNEGLFNPVFAGELAGLEGMSQGVGLEAVPSAIGSWREVPGESDPTTFPRDVSLDLNYSITASLRASVSVNTDFAEVESDQRRVNLTRFPLVFPERRDFFLEGSGVFSFAPRSGPNPFFSRRIGLNGGQQVPIEFGTRVAGQAAGFEIGVFQVRTGATVLDPVGDDTVGRFVPREDFTAARLRRRVFEQSSVGVVYTRRAGGGGGADDTEDALHTAGVDVELATRSFFGASNAQLSAFLVWNSDANVEGGRSFSELSARGFRLNFPNDVWSGHLSYREFGGYYDPALGFVTRNDFRRVEPRIGWSPRPESVPWIRRLDFAVQFRNLTDLETGRLEEREWLLNVLGVDFESGDSFGVNAVRSFEYLDRPFEISDGIVIEPGGYPAWRYVVRGSTTGRRRVSASGDISLGEFWNGRISGVSGGVAARPNPGIALSFNAEHNEVTLPQGRFSTNLYRLENEWHPSPWVSATSQVQYDDVSRIIGVFARLRWIVDPGNDIYIVYTHNWQNLGAGLLEDRDLITLSRGASMKLSYTYRF